MPKFCSQTIFPLFFHIGVKTIEPYFQASIFRVFQQIWRDLKTTPKDQSLRELAKFAKFILSKFLTVAASNKKVFTEVFFWKTSREATEIVEGYGTQTSSNKAKAAFWSSEEEERLTAVFGQVMEMERSGDNNDRQGDILDQIELMFSCENRSRRQIGNKLRELGHIQNMREITKKPLKSSRSWQDEEVDKLKELFEEFKEAENPGARIYEQWKAAQMPVRSKKKLCEKIVELGWVADRSKLGKVRRRTRKPKEGEAGFLNSRSDSDSALEDSSSGEEDEESGSDTENVATDARNPPTATVREALERLDGEEKKTLLWLADTLLEESNDRKEDFDGEDVPLVTVDQEIQTAMTKESVIGLFSSLGLCAPSQGEQFWRIPGDLTVEKLEIRETVLRKAGVGDNLEDVFEDVNMELLSVVRGFEAMKTVKTKKKKEKRNKWLPFRRPEDDDPTTSQQVKVKTPRQTKKAKNKSFLESSDEESPTYEANAQENDENVDPENKENVPALSEKKKVSPKKSVNPLDKVKKMDMDRLKKMLENDSLTDSDNSEDNKEDMEENQNKANMADVDIDGAQKKQKSKKKTAAKKKPVSRKGKEKKLGVDDGVNSSDDEENVKPKKKSPPKKKAKKIPVESSSDEGVVDPTQPSSERIRAESSADDSAVAAAKPAKQSGSNKPSRSIDSSSDEGVDDPTQPSVDPIKAATSEDDPDENITRVSKTNVRRNTTIDSSEEELVVKSTTKDNKKPVIESEDEDSNANDSRLSLDDSRAKSPTQWIYSPNKDDSRLSVKSSLDDSRAKSPTQWVYTPTKKSANDSLDDSRLSRKSSFDSRLSRRSSFESNSRSPLSSPLSSRSVSPSSPGSKIKSPVIKSTPAVKRLREDTPASAEKTSKKSRMMSPNKSLNLQLSDSSEQLEDSPVKKASKKVLQLNSLKALEPKFCLFQIA